VAPHRPATISSYFDDETGPPTGEETITNAIPPRMAAPASVNRMVQGSPSGNSTYGCQQRNAELHGCRSSRLQMRQCGIPRDVSQPRGQHP
jgi:hypothetical protein